MTATVSPNSPEPASSQMLKMLNAFLTVQALHVAAALGLADRLADGPRSADEVAGETNAEPISLYRLMRMLTGLGVLSEEADGQFALAPLGETLRSDVADSVRDWAIFVGAPEMWEVWAGLHGSVMTGEAAFPRVHGAAMWDYMAEHPHLGAAFNRWMTRQSDQHNAARCRGLRLLGLRPAGRHRRWPGIDAGCDLAGESFPTRRVPIDLPAVVEDQSRLRTAGVEDRCEVIGGDMFHDVPLHADADPHQAGVDGLGRRTGHCDPAQLRDCDGRGRKGARRRNGPRARATIRAPASPSTS